MNELQFEKKENEPGSIITVSTNRDPILCITVSEKYLISGHASGTINQYLLSSATHVHKIQLTNCAPYKISLNKNSSKLAIIDKSKFYVYDFDANNVQTGEEGQLLNIEFHDVWDMMWASDNNDMIAIIEKTKLMIVDTVKLEHEDSFGLNGCICSFSQFHVKTIALENLTFDSLNGQAECISDYTANIESKHIKQLRETMAQSTSDAISYLIQFPFYSSLWNIIKEESLIKLDLETAKLAMVKCKDILGLQFVKRVETIKDERLQKGEVCAYLGKLKESEQIYFEMDRPDLAIHMNKLTGNYDSVLRILQSK